MEWTFRMSISVIVYPLTAGLRLLDVLAIYLAIHAL